MNADQAIVNLKAVADYWVSRGKTRPIFSASVKAVANEVERLRAECERLAVQKYEADDEASACRAEIVNLNAELAAAKEASVCPVEVVACDPDYERKATVVLWSNADAQRFADWLRDRMKERSEQ